MVVVVAVVLVVEEVAVKVLVGSVRYVALLILEEEVEVVVLIGSVRYVCSS